ncbi:MAG: hypothetical protein ACLP8X_20950 [Streptosporangiaceae bacterium]
MPVRYDQDTQDDHRKANRGCTPLGCPALPRGRHVMVLTGADPDSEPASPRPDAYQDLFEVVTRGPGDARAFRRSRAGSVFLVRPDGHIAARGGRTG